MNAMRRIVLCVLAALTSVVQGSSQSAAFDSRPLSDSGLQNAIAFTRVLGYVQYFHPSDQAATMTWEAFTVAGMKQVEDAATPADLAGRMTTLFAPIAPSVLVFPTGPRPAIDPALHPADTTGLSVVRWDYLGFPSNPPSTSSPYSGARIFRSVIGGSMPAGFMDPASGFEADVGAGISCFVPVALYADGHGTLPRPTVSQPVLPALPAFVDNRALRLSIVAEAWNIARHFYPYFDVVNTDWLAALPVALNAAAIATDEPSMWDTILRLGAALHDGHFTGNTFREFTGPLLYVPPLAWDWIEGSLVVTYVADSQGQAIQAGDAVLSIDGTPVSDALAAVGSQVSAASRQYLLYASLARVAAGPSGTPVQLEIESGGSVHTVTMRRTQYTNLYETLGAVPEPRPAAIAEVETGIFYVDVSRATQTDWNAALSRLAAAKGIVIDYRGYPNFFPVSNFIHTTIPGLGLWMAKPSLPDQQSVAWQDGSWDLSGAQPWLAAKAVYLTDGRAISAAETALVIVESNKLAEIVGSPTAGSDGYVTWFTLFNLYGAGFTGEKALKPDGSPIHGIGSLPTVPLQRTRAGVAAGRDEILERGLALIRNPASRPVGPWVASAASWLPDSASPGAILTILAPALGPQAGAGPRLTADGLVDTLLNDTRVFFDDVAAPLLYVGPTQVNVVVPYGVGSKKNVSMRVEYQGQETLALGVGITPSAPGIFSANGSGRGQGAILNQDQTPNSSGNPADLGSVISLFVTGGGLTDILVVDGSLTGSVLPKPQLPVSVRIGGVAADVQYAGAAPGMVAGALQVNVRVPLGAAPGDAAVFLTIGDATSQPGITVRVRDPLR